MSVWLPLGVFCGSLVTVRCILWQFGNRKVYFVAVWLFLNHHFLHHCYMFSISMSQCLLARSVSLKDITKSLIVSIMYQIYFILPTYRTMTAEIYLNTCFPSVLRSTEQFHASLYFELI